MKRFPNSSAIRVWTFNSLRILSIDFKIGERGTLVGSIRRMKAISSPGSHIFRMFSSVFEFVKTFATEPSVTVHPSTYTHSILFTFNNVLLNKNIPHSGSDGTSYHILKQLPLHSKAILINANSVTRILDPSSQVPHFWISLITTRVSIPSRGRIRNRQLLSITFFFSTENFNLLNQFLVHTAKLAALSGFKIFL